MTQQQAADGMGISVVTYRSWEAGRYIPNLAQACALADLFHCSLDDLAGRDFSPDAPADARLDRIRAEYEAAGESGRALMAALVDVAARAR